MTNEKLAVGDRVLIGPKGGLGTPPWWLTVAEVGPSGELTVVDDDGMENTWPREQWSAEYEPRILQVEHPAPGTAPAPVAPPAETLASATEPEPFESPSPKCPPTETPPVKAEDAHPAESAREPAVEEPKDRPAAGSLAEVIERLRLAELHQNEANAALDALEGPHEAALGKVQDAAGEWYGAMDDLRELLGAMTEPFSGGVLPERFQAPPGLPQGKFKAVIPPPLVMPGNEPVVDDIPFGKPLADPNAPPGVTELMHEEDYEAAAKADSQTPLTKIKGISPAMASQMTNKGILTLSNWLDRQRDGEIAGLPWWQGVNYVSAAKAAVIEEAVADHIRSFRKKWGKD